MALPQPPVHLLEATSDGRMPPLTGILLAAPTSLLLWAAILTPFLR
ncbi:hypothetical protein AB2M62_07685 [Sphingomonas sp. MMS12-HWE2-04]